MKKHYTIPFFVTHKGCTHKCVFCDQKSITGQASVKPAEIKGKMEKYIETIPEHAVIEVGFFGGSFTGIPKDEQKKLLEPVLPFIENGSVEGIRISTRPDLINSDILRFLGDLGVTCIELGVQSMSDKVLKRSKRGHTAEDVVKASRLIMESHFRLGHQMMLGLPESTFRDEFHTAKMAKELGATQVRIYPVLVIKNTELAKWWRDKKYSPLTEDEAVERSARLISYFNSNGMTVLRCGLHPSEELSGGASLLAGPFHTSFRQKAESRIFAWMLERLLEDRAKKIAKISFNPDDEGAFHGFGGSNSSILEKVASGRKDIFAKSAKVPRGCLLVDRV